MSNLAQVAGILDALLSRLNFWPSLKTRLAAVAALALAVVQAWNAATPGLGLEGYALEVPAIVNALVLALLGVGAANQPKNLGAR